MTKLTYTSELNFRKWVQETDPAELKRVLDEYVGESTHGSWEGFTSRDVTGIRRFMDDLRTYHNSVRDSAYKGT
jgi:hypothetical protein